MLLGKSFNTRKQNPHICSFFRLDAFLLKILMLFLSRPTACLGCYKKLKLSLPKCEIMAFLRVSSWINLFIHTSWKRNTIKDWGLDMISSWFISCLRHADKIRSKHSIMFGSLVHVQQWLFWCWWETNFDKDNRTPE